MQIKHGMDLDWRHAGPLVETMVEHMEEQVGQCRDRRNNTFAYETRGLFGYTGRCAIGAVLPPDPRKGDGFFTTIFDEMDVKATPEIILLLDKAQEIHDSNPLWEEEQSEELYDFYDELDNGVYG